MVSRVKRKFKDKGKVGDITVNIKDQRYLIGVLEILYVSE